MANSASLLIIGLVTTLFIGLVIVYILNIKSMPNNPIKTYTNPENVFFNPYTSSYTSWSNKNSPDYDLQRIPLPRQHSR